MHADVLLRGGAIHTMDPRQPGARSLAVAAGRILACESCDDAADALIGPHTRVIDLTGRAVVPGFVDAHVHFGHFALARLEVNLDRAVTLEEGLAEIRRHAERLPDDQWIRGRGWDRNRWGRLPTQQDLDVVSGGRPAALSSHDGHSLWLNSAALRITAIDKHTPDPASGVIERDQHGEPTGVLFENAQDLVRRRIPQASDRELRDALLDAQRLAAAAGLTGIHNLEDARTRRVFQSLNAEGELRLRVYHGIPRGELSKARERGLRTGDGTDFCRIGPLKLFSDGALGSRTAYLLEPYEGRSDGYRGVATLTEEELCRDMRAAADAELDLAVHAIGDAAVRRVLDAYEATRADYPPLRDRMLRIEHAQLVHPDDVTRFRELGVIASMQPIHAAADWRAADRHWGNRARHGYAWRDLQRAGATLAFGTDAPVERIEPLHGLYTATTRLDERGEPRGGWYTQQCVTLEQAVRAYTVGSAVAERAEARRGTLARGMDADLVVLSPDPFELEPQALLDTRVQMTMLGGRFTLEAA